MNDVIAGIGLFLLVLVVVMPLSVLIGAFVLYTLWGWFIVPLGVAQIGFWLAAGINLIVSSFFLGDIEAGISDIRTKLADGDSIWGRVWGSLLGRPIFILILGAIIHALM